jgi:hypothetical protein
MTPLVVIGTAIISKSGRLAEMALVLLGMLVERPAFYFLCMNP